MTLRQDAVVGSTDPEATRQAVGRATSLFDLALMSAPGGQAVAAGATVVLPYTRMAVDFADCHVDDIYFQCYGQTAAGADVPLQLYDETRSTVLATLTLTTTLGLRNSGWTRIAPPGGTSTIAVRVVGNGANAQTLYSLRVQGRTVNFLT